MYRAGWLKKYSSWLNSVRVSSDKVMVRTSSGFFEPWDKSKIVEQLLKETVLAEEFFGIPPISREEAEIIASEAERRIFSMNTNFVSAPLIREIVSNILLEWSNEKPEYIVYRNVLTRVGTPVYDAYLIDLGLGFEAKENANLQPNPETSHKKKADKLSKEQYLLLLPVHVADAHLKGDIHIHDLEYFGTRPFCVSKDEKVVFQNSEIICIEPIASLIERCDLVEIVDGWEIYVPSREVKVLSDGVFRPIRKVFRRRYNGFLLEIETVKGLKLKCTPDHKVKTKNGFRRADKLKIGDEVEIMEKIMCDEINEVNLLNIIDGGDNWYVKPVEIVNVYKLHKLLGVPYSTVYYWKMKKYMPLSKYRELLSTFRNTRDLDDCLVLPKTLYIKYGRSKKYVKAKLLINRDLGELLGLYISEGHYGSKEITITNSEFEILDRFRELCIRVFGLETKRNVNLNTPQEVLYSKTVSQIFRALGLDKKSFETFLPPIFLKGNTDFLIGFLSGLMSGDGSVRILKGNRQQLTLITCSEKLADQIIFIFKRLGITPNISKYFKHNRMHPMFQIVISYKKDIEALLSKGLKLIGRKRKVLRNICFKYSKFNEYLEMNSRKIKIKSIRKIPYHDYVYDLMIDGEEHCYSNLHGIIVHNCQDHDLRYYFYYGLMPDGTGFKTSVAGPAMHPEVAILHSVKVLAAAQTNFAGGQGFYNYNIFLAPFLKGLSFKQVKQLAQMMFYELSIDADEYLVVENLGELKLVKAGEYLDSFFDGAKSSIKLHLDVLYGPKFKVCCYDPVAKKLRFVDATAIIRHSIDEPLLQITTRNGRIVRVTGDHSLFTINDDGYIVPVKARDLAKGDWIVAIGCWPPLSDSIEEINLIDLIKSKNLLNELGNYRVKLAEHVLLRYKSDIKAIGLKLGFTNKAIEGWFARRRIPLRVIASLKLSRKDLIGAKILPPYHKKPYIPCLLVLNEKFLRLLGYYVAEGSICKRHLSLGVIISISDTHIRDEISFYVRELFGVEPTENGRFIRFGGKIHALLFSELLGAGPTSHEKHIPPILFKLNVKLISEFLFAYHRGDGFTCKDRVGFDTVSRSLANGLVFLLQKLGLYPIVKKRKRITCFTRNEMKVIYRVLVTGWRDISKLLEIIPNLKDANKLNYILSKSKGREIKRRIPLFKRLREKLKQAGLPSAYNPKVRSVAIDTVLTKLGNHAFQIGDLSSFLNGQLVAEEVISIEEVESSNGYVYDIEVLGFENFSGGHLGQFLLHNTQCYVARGGQLVFSNVQLCPGVPEIWRDKPVVFRGRVGPESYGDFEEEARLFFRAIYEVALEGDYLGKPFNFPKLETYITPEFFNSNYYDEWLIVHKVASKYGTPYFDNAIPPYRGYGKGVSCYQCCAYTFTETPEDDPEFEEKMCFVDGKHFSMGAWQVVTLNLPRAAYRANGDDDKLIEEIFRSMDLAIDVFKAKMKWMKLMIENNRLPFATQRPRDPRTGSRGPAAVDFNELVYVIGIVGGNEMVQWHTGFQLHESDSAVRLLVKVLLHMRKYMEELEVKHGIKLALARTPAESCAQRLAVCDLLSDEFRSMTEKVVKGDVDRAEKLLGRGERNVPVYYSNGTHVYVGAKIPLSKRLLIEHKFFPVLSGGNIFHVWLGEAYPDPEALLKVTERISTKTQVGYFAYTKDLTICNSCGRISFLLHEKCPHCSSSDVHWWSRVTGYYQDVSGWNESKKRELLDRYRIRVSKF